MAKQTRDKKPESKPIVGLSVKGNPEIWDDTYVYTTCGGCYGQCAIRAHRVNGVIVADTVTRGVKGSLLLTCRLLV